MKTPEEYIDKISQWAKTQDVIAALALVGSHARKQARPDSDIDFLLLCNDKEALLKNLSWINHFGKVVSFSREAWGIVTSVRVFYKDKQEVEFGIGPLSWADIPVNHGTRQAVKNGIVILKDSCKLLEKLTNYLVKYTEKPIPDSKIL